MNGLHPLPREFFFKEHAELCQIALRGSVAGLGWNQTESPGLIKIPFGFNAIAENDVSADERTWTHDLVHAQSDGPGRRFAWVIGRGSQRSAQGRRGLGSFRRSGKRLRLFLGDKFEIVHEKTSFHIGQPDSKLLVQTLLDFGKLRAPGDPAGDFLFLFIGQLHGGRMSEMHF